MKRILMVSPISFHKVIGGIEKHVLHISSRIKRNGYDVSVLTTGRSHATYTLTFDDVDIDIEEVRGYSPFDSYHISPALYSVVLNRDFDVLHVHGYSSFTSATALLAYLRKKRENPLLRCFMTSHSSGQNARFNTVLYRPYNPLMRMLVQDIDKYICVSQYEREKFKGILRLSEDKITVIGNGVDPREFAETHSSKDTSVKRLVSIGRLEEYKGHEKLIRAFSIAAQTIPAIELRIFGNGTCYHRLTNIIGALQLGSKVTVFRDAPRQQVIQALKSADLFVLLSRFESQGIVVLEALAAGVPVLIADNSALSEFIQQKTAFGVKDTASAKEVADTLISLLTTNPDKPNYCVPTWDEIAGNLLELYKG